MDSNGLVIPPFHLFFPFGYDLIRVSWRDSGGYRSSVTRTSSAMSVRWPMTPMMHAVAHGMRQSFEKDMDMKFTTRLNAEVAVLIY